MAKGKKRNITIKILAVFIATIMWFYVMSEINPRITKEFTNVKVTLKNSEAIEQSGLIIMDPIDTSEITIDVTVVGLRNDVLKLSEKDIEAFVDMRGSTEGEKRMSIYVDSLEKVQVESYYPKEAVFKIDSIISEEKQVKIETSGKVADGYSIGTPKINPNSVYIKGARSWVNSVTDAIATVTIDGKKEDIVVNVPYIAKDNNNDREVLSVQKEPEIVEVIIPVYKVKNVAIEPQIEGTPLQGFEITKIEVIPKNIQIMGYKDVINPINIIQTKPINIDYMTSDFSKEAELIIPEGILLKNNDIKPVIKIISEPLIEKTLDYTVDDITFINIKEGLEIDNLQSTNSFSITIKGIESLVNETNKVNITPYIDLKDLEEGKHDLAVNIIGDDEIEIIDISPKTMKIILKKTEDSSIDDTDQEDENANNADVIYEDENL